MAWIYVGSGTAVLATGTSHVLTEPAGVAAGDLLVACIGSRIASTTQITLPSGWTRVGQQLNNNVLSTTSAVPSGMMATIIRGASAPGYTFTHPATPSIAVGRVVAYRNVDPAGPLDSGVTQATTATSITSISVAGLTTTADDDLIVALVATGRINTVSNFNATDPGTSSGTGADNIGDPVTGQWLERTENSTPTGADVSLTLFDAVKAAAGTTGNLVALTVAAGGNVVIAGSFKLLMTAGEPHDNVLETEGGNWRETEAGAVRLIDTTSIGTLGTTLGAATLSAGGKIPIQGLTSTATAPATLVAAGRLSIKGTLSSTPGPATVTATGTVVWPLSGGSLSQALAPATLAAAGLVYDTGVEPREHVRETQGVDWRETEEGAVRIIDSISLGTLSATLAPAALAAGGTIWVGGTLVAMAAPAALAATGTATPGPIAPDHDDVRETEAGDWRESEDGTVRIVDRTSVGVLDATLDPAALSAAGALGLVPILGELGGALRTTQLDAVRLTEAGDWRATEGGLTLAEATLSGSGFVYTPIVGTSVGFLNSAPAPATLAAAGTLGPLPQAVGALDITLAQVALSATGSSGYIAHGTLVATLAPATLDAAGGNAATLDVTLADATLSAAGHVPARWTREPSVPRYLWTSSMGIERITTTDYRRITDDGRVRVTDSVDQNDNWRKDSLPANRWLVTIP